MPPLLQIFQLLFLGPLLDRILDHETGFVQQTLQLRAFEQVSLVYVGTSVADSAQGKAFWSIVWPSRLRGLDDIRNKILRDWLAEAEPDHFEPTNPTVVAPPETLENLVTPPEQIRCRGNSAG
jgi:hypothetical protein